MRYVLLQYKHTCATRSCICYAVPVSTVLPVDIRMYVDRLSMLENSMVLAVQVQVFVELCTIST